MIVGGMSLGTLLTLYVVPAVYSYLGHVPQPAETEEPEAARAPSPAE